MGGAVIGTALIVVFAFCCFGIGKSGGRTGFRTWDLYHVKTAEKS